MVVEVKCFDCERKATHEGEDHVPLCRYHWELDLMFKLAEFISHRS
jgi:hypothetical protein